MPAVTVKGRGVRYETIGDGFPLILVPDANGTVHDWDPAMPLFGELCRVIAYEYDQLSPPRVQPPQVPLIDRVADLAALFECLAVERAYLAGVAVGALTALTYARHHPKRLEGSVCIGLEEPTQPPDDAGTAADAAIAVPLQGLTVPTLLVAGEQAAAQVAWATRSALQCPQARTEIITRTKTPHREQPLQLGHIMVRFLLQCERQRNLVRGASFLL